MAMAIRIHQTGGPEVLTWENVPVGDPGPGEVRLRQTAVGLNYIDVYQRTGLYPMPNLPAVIGMEAAGVVEAVGEGVTEVAVGQRVAYADNPPGAYAEARLMPAHRLVAVPDAIDDKTAAAAFMSYWLGRWRWWIAPERFKNAIAATIPKVALEFSIAIDAKSTALDYAEIEAPTLLIKGSKTPPPTRAVTDLLGKTLPNVEVKTLKGAGHMSPFTHPEELNRLILDHLMSRR